MIIIPYQQLSRQALQGLLEEYASRDGTEYGWQEIPLATKVAQLTAQLADGSVCIVYDEQTDSCNLMLAADIPTVNS